MDKQVIVDLGLDTVAMLGYINGLVNALLRERLKPYMNKKYQALYTKVTAGSSKLLFGEDLQEWLKAASQADVWS